MNIFKKFNHFILYGIIGGISAGLDFVIFTGLVYAGFNPILTNILSIHCGIFCSFLLNRYFNFKIKDKTIIRFLSFYFIGLLGLGLSTFLLWLLTSLMFWDVLGAKLFTIVVVAILQFILNKYITFRKS